jgi:hypothetical protein
MPRKRGTDLESASDLRHSGAFVDMRISPSKVGKIVDISRRGSCLQFDVETHPLWERAGPLAMPWSFLLKSRWRSHESGVKPYLLNGAQLDLFRITQRYKGCPSQPKSLMFA